MWKRIALYSALAAAIGCFAWLTLRSRREEAASAVQPIAAPAKPAVPGGDPYRLGPDVRVLQAAGDLHRLVTGGPLEDARADYEAGGWRISHRGVEVGTLPAFPEYDDLERLLSRWALDLGLRDSLKAWRRSRARRAGDRAAIAGRLSRLEATAAADLADRMWSQGVRDTGVLRLAAHALALLGAQTVDEVGGADRVAARGLALVSVCAALDPNAVAADAALVADGMGYATAALARTASLPEDHPVRRFVREEDEALEKEAARPKATREARFLALVRLARRHELDRWQQWLERHFLDDRELALALTCTALEIGRFEMHMPAAMQVLAGVVQDLKMIGEVGDGEDPTAGTGSLDELIREFERLMGEMRPNADGVFLDAGVLRAYYRTCFYSALAIVGEHLRESLSSSPDTRAFANDLGDAAEGAAGEFQRWYTHLANAKLGRPEIPELRKDLQSMPHFGAPLLFATFAAIEEHSTYGDVGVRAAARRLASRLDTRPSHLTAYADIVRRRVLDLGRAEDLFDRGIRSGASRDLRLTAWWAGYRQDRESLERLLLTPGLAPREQADILNGIVAIPGTDTNAVEAGFKRCIASQPESWELVDAYSRLLRARGYYEPARALLQRWLDRKKRDADPFDEIFARTRLARNYADQGRYERAIEAVEPVVGSQQFGAMDCMVSLLEKTGRLARAETLAVFAWGRYPDSPAAQARVIELCWRQRKLDLAARMLVKAPVPLRAFDFRSELAPHFLECFRGSPGDGIRAVEAILAAGHPVPAHLRYLAAAVSDAGDPRMAFEIQSRIPAQGQEAILNLELCYHHRKRWKGEADAIAWLRPHLRALAPAERALLAYVAYETGDDELLWEIDDVGPERSSIDFQWLMRAAAAARAGASRDPHRAELARHFERPEPGHYVVLGRFLLGHESQAAALASATDARSTCEVFYYLGLEAQARGRIREAADWYLRCVETGQFYNGEYRWAYDQLYKWAGSNVSLARISAEAEAKTGRPRPLAGARD